MIGFHESTGDQNGQETSAAVLRICFLGAAKLKGHAITAEVRELAREAVVAFEAEDFPRLGAICDRLGFTPDGLMTKDDDKLNEMLIAGRAADEEASK